MCFESKFVFPYRILVQYVITAAAAALFVISLELFIAMIAFPFSHKSFVYKDTSENLRRRNLDFRTSRNRDFLRLKFLFMMMNILCLFLATFTLSRFIFIFSITSKHERRIVSLQVQYPDLKRWGNFGSHALSLPTTYSNMTMSGLIIKVNWTLWASFSP